MKQLQTTILLLLCVSTVLFSQEIWVSRTLGTTNQLSGVFYNNNQFIVTDSMVPISTSPDGITWTSRTSSTTISTAITYGNNVYAILSGTGVYTSSDGIT